MTFDIGYDMTTWHRILRASISIASILRTVTFEIEGCNHRYYQYWTRMISKKLWYQSLPVELWYQRSYVAVLYRRNIDIEVRNFDIGIMISRYQRCFNIDKGSFYTSISIQYRSFCASISNFVFFDISVFLSDPAWATVACSVHIPGEAAADSTPNSWTRSRLFEINMWMWRYGRTFPRRISVDQAVQLRKKRVQESRARGTETLRRRRDEAWAKGASPPQWMTLGECYVVYDIEPDMLWHDMNLLAQMASFSAWIFVRIFDSRWYAKRTPKLGVSQPNLAFLGVSQPRTAHS